MRHDKLVLDADFNRFFESILFVDSAVNRMMQDHVQGGGTKNTYNVSCDWVKDNMSIWKNWIKNTPLVVIAPPTETTTPVDIGLIIGIVIAVLFVISLPIVWKFTENSRRMAKLLDNNKVATELAVSVSNLQFDEVAYLDDIEKPTKIQASFIKIVKSLKEFRNFMPASLTGNVDSNDEEEEAAEEEEVQKKDDGSKASGGRRASKARGDNSSRASSRASSDQFAATGGARIMAAASMEVKKKRITVMVINIRGFHHQNNKLSLEDSSKAHSQYVKAVLDVVGVNKGTPDVFTGDRFTATWNTSRPNGTHCTNACHAVLQSSAAAKALKEPFELSAGVSSSEVRCGNMGCDGMKKYTFIGICASFAPMLERLNKNYGTSFLIDAAVEDQAQNNFLLRKIAHVNVKRLEDKRPMKLFELTGAKAVSEEEWMYQLENGNAKNPYAAYTSAVDLYLAGKSAEALDAVNGMAAKDAACQRLFALLSTTQDGTVPTLQDLD